MAGRVWGMWWGSTLLLLSACGGGDAGPSQTALVVAGDSITLQSGACNPGQALADCREDYWPHPERAFSNFIEAATAGRYHVVANAGRSGDTCTPQRIYDLGPFLGEARGLLARLDRSVLAHQPAAVSVLIGINDLNTFGVPLESVVACNVQVWTALHTAGVQVIAMTYPAISQTAHGWGQADGVSAAQAWALNQALREAWAVWQVAHPGGRLVDAELAWPAAQADAMTVDGAHPSVEGAQAVAAVWR